ncbi:hypothetical protein A2U01_0094545, partial [Trifolium medium]|nr:hypothetical protein [Trifolium medium]
HVKVMEAHGKTVELSLNPMELDKVMLSLNLQGR